MVVGDVEEVVFHCILLLLLLLSSQPGVRVFLKWWRWFAEIYFDSRKVDSTPDTKAHQKKRRKRHFSSYLPTGHPAQYSWASPQAGLGWTMVKMICKDNFWFKKSRVNPLHPKAGQKRHFCSYLPTGHPAQYSWAKPTAHRQGLAHTGHSNPDIVKRRGLNSCLLQCLSHTKTKLE